MEVLEHRQDWNGDRVYYHDESGCLRSMPSRWTNLIKSDLFERFGRGRAPFRIDDLIRLIELIEQIQGDPEAEEQGQ